MEITSKFKERDHQYPSPLNSPSSSTTTSCNNVNHTHTHNHPPIPITRSDPNSPYPTTFVTADSSSFKQVVQMLTGSSESPSKNPKQADPSPSQPTTTNSSRNFVIPPIRTAPKKQGFKLYERRNSLKNFMISPLNNASINSPNSFSPRHKAELLSPSLLDFPSLTLSPVTPLLEDPFDKSSPSVGRSSASSSSSEEAKAIAEKGFYMHPSPMSTPRESEPQLLPLFPLSSPRVSDS